MCGGGGVCVCERERDSREQREDESRDLVPVLLTFLTIAYVSKQWLQK